MSAIETRVNLIMKNSTTPYLLTEDVVAKLRTKYPRDYSRVKVKELTRTVTKAVSAYRQKVKDDAAATAAAASSSSSSSSQNEINEHQAEDEAVNHDKSLPKFNLLNAGMRRRYTTTKTSASTPNGTGATNTPSSSASSSPSVSISTDKTTGNGNTSSKRSRRSREDGSSRSGKRQKGNKDAASSGTGGNNGTNGGDAGKTSSYNVESTGRYADLGGIEKCMQDVRELIEYPLSHPEIYAHLGVEPPRGILLHGPPGCGKTSLANAIAGELGVAFLRVSAPEIVSGMSGQSEQKVRSLFEEAIAKAPCLVFIDEIDAITPKRETASRGMERRIVAQLLTCLDSLTMENTGGQAVMVIGATNRPDSLDPALRRAGRFDREICMSVPDKNARARILIVLCNKLTLDGDLDIDLIAKSTPGFVGADLVALTKEAAVIAVNRIFRKMLSADDDSNTLSKSSSTSSSLSSTSSTSLTTTSTSSTSSTSSSTSTPSTTSTTSVAPPAYARDRSHSLDERTRVSHRLKNSGPLTKDELSVLSVTMDDFLAAVKKVQPSAKREGFATAPNVTFDDIGALQEVRDDLEFSIMQPIKNPERFEAVGLQVPAGVLLYGPPGCGKTMLAKAIAHESGANFISVKGPELLDKYVGESEKAVRQVFHRAQMSSPCVIFFDELDALCPKRGGSGGGGGGVSERVVNQLLTELDGMETRRNVFVIAATNRPDIIDQAMLRPGRLDKLLYVPLPKPSDRISILKTLARKSPLASDVKLDEIASDARCNGYSGADVAALLREATVQALKMGPPGEKVIVKQIHFESALNRITPSVSERDQKRYLRMKNKLSHSRLGVTDGNVTDGNVTDGNEGNNVKDVKSDDTTAQ